MQLPMGTMQYEKAGIHIPAFLIVRISTHNWKYLIPDFSGKSLLQECFSVITSAAVFFLKKRRSNKLFCVQPMFALRVIK
jgi:hypothetical protein